MSEVRAGPPSTKPYLIRAIYDWCADNGLTPYLAVRVDGQTRVPMAYVKDGEIVLNLGPEAVRNLHLGNDIISCGGRFGGVPHEIMVPVVAVIGIFAKENGQGLAFEGQEPELSPPEGGSEAAASHSKPRLRVVK
ncbi:MAG TPA: ClpXP protease specificity-enhancing factor [Gallionellaceae bacterium]|nr:ClpXP protease specificity-enhancing factor [Gallionellaceae bacterium]